MTITLVKEVWHLWRGEDGEEWEHREEESKYEKGEMKKKKKRETIGANKQYVPLNQHKWSIWGWVGG